MFMFITSIDYKGIDIRNNPNVHSSETGLEVYDICIQWYSTYLGELMRWYCMCGHKTMPTAKWGEEKWIVE